MHKTVVLNVVGLTPSLLGASTSFLTQWAAEGTVAHVTPSLPAVTCSVQSSYLTGKWPESHGIVGNGWYFREECEIKFWRQSNKLVTAPKIWETAKKLDPSFTCSNMFWWYNMYHSIDYSVTPRPMYPADGRKIPDCYAHPSSLREELTQRLGRFPLFEFWGPKTSIRASEWIAKASKIVEEQCNPTLTLIYLPHLDYNLQRLDPEDLAIAADLREIDTVCADLIQFYTNRGARVVVLSEYGITPVTTPVSLNRVLREKGWVQVREELGLELLDAGASTAFAVADHQVAHVYVNDKSRIPEVRELLENVPGVERVLGEEEKATHHINHPRAGELVAIADAQSWFNYYYWLDDRKAPDFARTVDIHRKPGYDPVELFLDPTTPLITLKVIGKLIKKALGFRYLMDVIPLDATLVKGSHGRYPPTPEEGPLLITRHSNLLPATELQAPTVHEVILQHLTTDL